MNGTQSRLRYGEYARSWVSNSSKTGRRYRMVMVSLGGMVVALYGLAAGFGSLDPQIFRPQAVVNVSAYGPLTLGAMDGPVDGKQAAATGPHEGGAARALVGGGGSVRPKLAALGYDLKHVRIGRGVPPAYLSELPRDLRELMSPQVRKTAFIKVMLPLILRANRGIAEDRRRLATVLAEIAGDRLIPESDEVWLRGLAERYGVPLPDTLAELSGEPAISLMRRVDVVPPSLAIAQAAEESGWGTSRFAQEGNAVYGQWTWSEGAGIVPRERVDGKVYEVRKFPSLQDSVNGYMRNLNTHAAYADFREKRLRLRSEGVEPIGTDLVDTLSAYSERRGAYIETLRTIIRVNRLVELDNARLAPRPAAFRL